MLLGQQWSTSYAATHHLTKMYALMCNFCNDKDVHIFRLKLYHSGSFRQITEI